MTTGATGQLGLALPVQGELSGTWGDTVNNGITQYTNIAIAGTLTLTGDGAVTLANTTGDASASNITSSLSGAGTVTAQFAVVNISGTTTAKTITGPSYSKTYVVDNAGSYAVTFKASGQTGVTVAAGEKCTVYYNGTDYVKVASSVTDGVATISFGSTGLTPSTATSGAVTVAGTLAVANGGTGATSLTANNVILGNGTSAVQVVAPSTAGNVLTSNGTTWTSAVLPAGGLTYVVKTSNYTTQDKEGVLADTTAGAFTVTLPASPSTGAQVVVADSAGTWGTNNLTVGRNGSTIAGSASDLVCDISGVAVQLVYNGTTWDVYAQVGGNGGTVVTEAGTQTLTNKTISGAANTLSNISLTTAVTGTLPIANGGTNSTATPTAGTVSYGTGTALGYTSVGTSGQLLQSNGSSAPSWVDAPTGGFSNIAVLTSGTSWTAPTGITKIKVTATGGGAAGGGANTTDGQRRGGGGGGAGTAIKVFTVTPGSSYTYAIGAGGTAGTAGANPGNAGGNTTFTVGATTITANGGSAGSTYRTGGAGGTASNGDLNLTGVPGISTDWIIGTSGNGPSGNGGASFWGGGGRGQLNETGQSANGNPGTTYGSGGGGGVDNNSAARTGGAGAAGVIVIEY